MSTKTVGVRLTQDERAKLACLAEEMLGDNAMGTLGQKVLREWLQAQPDPDPAKIRRQVELEERRDKVKDMEKMGNDPTRQSLRTARSPRPARGARRARAA